MMNQHGEMMEGRVGGMEEGGWGGGGRGGEEEGRWGEGGRWGEEVFA